MARAMLRTPPRIEAGKIPRRARHPTTGSVGAYTDQNAPAIPANPPARIHVIRRTRSVRIPDARARSKFEAIARIPFPIRVRVNRRWRPITEAAVAAGDHKGGVGRVGPGPKPAHGAGRRFGLSLRAVDEVAGDAREDRMARPGAVDAARGGK